MPVLLVLSVMVYPSCREKDMKISPNDDHDLVFTRLSKHWDEAIPLGNGMMGALVWKKGKNLRISLDRADLWDLRPMENMYDPGFTYEWVYEQWKNNTYLEAQLMGDRPYDESAGPSKIPAAAIEIPIEEWGPVESVRLFTHHGICRVIWENGIEMEVFVHAQEPAGWIRITGHPPSTGFYLIPPLYYLENTDILDDPVTGQDLRLLGYPRGNLVKEKKSMNYVQEGWNGFKYQVHIDWSNNSGGTMALWSISAHHPGDTLATAEEMVLKEKKKGYQESLQEHLEWWSEFWDQSSIALPDSILEKQWYLEQYKFGSAARIGAPPISLQAIWTADNGRLPPWKGDFHHDLNTQLSYWPAYSSNHLDIEEGFINWLWKYRPVFEKYTDEYYASGGLNVPGVTTLTGEPMGGWIQYSLGPTVAAWLGHHFYLHWRYSMDSVFLKEKAYPWLTAVARHFDNIAVEGEDGLLKLPLSSSPEINNNSRDAWFSSTTNFDLALIRWTYSKASEMALALGKNEEARQWKERLAEWPGLAVDEQTGLMIAPGTTYENSHRHFSHLMAWHPLGLLDVNMGEDEKEIVNNTLDNLLDQGTDWWTGYSFSWLGNLQARALNGDEAAEALGIFAKAFCLPNSFHVNGDQSGEGYSRFTYRPFTLEGNFAFAAGLQEMLIQSHAGAIVLFPAIPGEWEDISFDKLRTEGAFLVSAIMEGGEITEVEVISLAGADCRIKNPFAESFDSNKKGIKVSAEFIEFETSKNEKVVMKAKW